MTTANNAAPAATNTATTVTTTAPAAAPAAKTPSLKSRAATIFAAKLAERAAGLFASNKEFRGSILGEIEKELGVSRASASTMYNSFKKEAETAGTATLGRDPKKVKAPSTGKRGRPAGSGKKAEEAAPAAEGTGLATEAAAPAVAEATA